MSPAMALADQARHFLQSKRERRGQIGANDVVDDARSRHRMCPSVIRLRITLDADWGSNGAPIHTIPSSPNSHALWNRSGPAAAGYFGLGPTCGLMHCSSNPVTWTKFAVLLPA